MNASEVLDQNTTPYADAIRSLAENDWQRLHVPGHQAKVENAPGLEPVVGAQALALDFPMLMTGVDQTTWRTRAAGNPTPLMQAQALAADAWGARRTWFITNGASGGNHIATMVVKGLGTEFAVQRSVHSSVIDGVVHAGLTPNFIHGVIDAGLGAAHGVTAAQVEAVLSEHPESSAVYIVTPSYFGAVADVAAIAEVAHRHGIPLIVDEAWGSHFGMHSELPVNAVRLGADLVISSTHKGAGSLTQSAMLQLGHGPYAENIESLVDRVVRSYQSTSCSSLLLSSLDEARRHLAANGTEAIGAALESVHAIRRGIRQSERFRDATPAIVCSEGAVDYDPFKIAIDMREAGITGNDAQYLLIRDHQVYCELSTPTTLLLLVGATSPVDVDRLLTALHALPLGGDESPKPEATLVLAEERAMLPTQAFFSDVEVVGYTDAIGRVSADSLAAYPPGVPNVLPGEVLSEEVVNFLRSTAAAPSGYVRGARDESLEYFRVVVRK